MVAFSIHFIATIIMWGDYIAKSVLLDATARVGDLKKTITFLHPFDSSPFHFGLIKFHVQYGKVPEGANRYWWKVFASSLEFGSMHAILFQAALIPLTMARASSHRFAFAVRLSSTISFLSTEPPHAYPFWPHNDRNHDLIAVIFFFYSNKRICRIVIHSEG